jgi:hypothetical protein
MGSSFWDFYSAYLSVLPLSSPQYSILKDILQDIWYVKVNKVLLVIKRAPAGDTGAYFGEKPLD